MKYILKKEYPGSPKLGNIIDNLENDWIENYPEFWQEVIEKNYEILSLVASEKNPQHKKGSKFLHNKDYGFKNMHPTEFWDIYSVKRISDNKIFTIGDSYEDLIIEKMFMSVAGDIFTTYKPKIKKPLFTTEDAVDIFEGDSYYAVNTTFFNNYGSQKAFDKKSPDLTPFWQSNRSVCKYFSTKEKAEDYILLNKPCLSYGEVQEYLKVKDCNKVLDLAQSKIQQSV